MALDAAKVALIFSRNFDFVACFDEERGLDDEAGRGCDGFEGRARGVPAESVRGFRYLHFDGDRKLDLDWIIIDEEHVDGVTFVEKVFCFFNEVFGKDDVFKSVWVHEVVAHVVNIAELEALRVGREDINRFG